MGLLAFSGAEDGVLDVDITGTVIASTTQARTGTYSFRVESHYSTDMYNYFTLLFAGASTIYFQFGMWVTTLTTQNYSEYTFVRFNNGGNTLLCLSYPMNCTTIKLWRGARATLLASSAVTFTVGAWQVFDGKVVIDGTNGIFQLRKNGVTIIDYAGNTKPGTDSVINALSFGNMIANAGGGWFYYDDVIVCDNAGAYMNDWLGGLKVHRLAPTGAGNYAQWTPSAGNNWECVDETPPSNTDKVTDATSGHRDSYVMTDLPTDAKQIKAVVSRFWGEGGGQVKRLLRIGGQDYVGNALTLPAAFGKVDEILYASPASGAGFTATEINGLESGMENV